MRRQLPFIYGGEGSARHAIFRSHRFEANLGAPDGQQRHFLREVDENLRRDQFQDFFKKNGKWIALGVVLFLAAAGGFIYWQEYRNRQAAEQSEQLHATFIDIAKGNRRTVPQRLGKLEQSHSEVIRASAMLTDAALALDTEQPHRGNRQVSSSWPTTRALPKSTATSARSA